MGLKIFHNSNFFNDCKVPVENLIGKRGEGFRIALNILHIGRIKLGANVLGAGKKSIVDSVKYANERKQFGTFISNFGAIKFKIGLNGKSRYFVSQTALIAVYNKMSMTLLKLHIANGFSKTTGLP